MSSASMLDAPPATYSMLSGSTTLLRSTSASVPAARPSSKTFTSSSRVMAWRLEPTVDLMWSLKGVPPGTSRMSPGSPRYDVKESPRVP